MELRVLGTVEAFVDGSRIGLGSRKQRLVLAVLLLEANRPVLVDRLIDIVWGQRPPPSAQSSLQALVSRLRSAFRDVPEDQFELVRQGAGYLLRVDPRTVDVHRFTDLVHRAGQADAEQAIELLDRALALWRGDPLADVADGQVRQRLVIGLREARWTALEDRADAQLNTGRWKAALGSLVGLVAEQPLRQRLVGHLMLALHYAGRTDEALDAYNGLRHRLTEELGLEPSAELRQLQTSLLNNEPRAPEETPPGRVPPAELPHDVIGFVGRADELAVLDTGLDSSSASTRIWVISGPAGVGKTSLAVHWARRSRPYFPDGQLYVDLRGFDPEQEPLAPQTALTQLLRGLGADPRLVPDDLDGQVGLFRTLLADKHMLMVLDNVHDTGQVLPLIPPQGTAILTSRQRLGEIVARSGARPVALDVLPPHDSIRLLVAALGAAHVQAEESAAVELADRCGHLPLALRVAVANIGTGPQTRIADVARDLALGDPLRELTVDGADQGPVAAALAVSYRALTPEHRLLFRRLGLVPGLTFTAQAAGAVTGCAASAANRRLTALAAAHLIEPTARGRYRFHDLLRSYAIDRASAEDTTDDRDEARRRLFESYLQTADAAGRVLIPHFLRLPRQPPPDAFADTDTALAWLDAEWPNLAAAIRHAGEHGPRAMSWHLADALRAYFHHRGHRAEWLGAASTALSAAEAEGDRRAQAAMHQSIALACVNTGRYIKAREHLTNAMRVNVADSWLEGQAAVLNNLSAVHQRLGSPEEAITCGLRSLELTRELGGGAGVVMALANLGFAHWQLGDLTQALEHFTDALRLGEQANADYSVAVLLVDLGNTYRDLGQHETAEDFYARALEANRALDYAYGQATALSGRALLRCRTSASPATRSDAVRAVELTRKIGDEGTEAWTLNALGTVCLCLDLPADAEQHHRRALELAKATSFFWCEAEATAGLAEALLDQGDADESRTTARKAVALARRAGYRLIERRAQTTIDRGHRAADLTTGRRRR